MEDDLRSEYNLKNLRVRRLGTERKSFAGQIVRLDPDVAEIFPNADSVNEALRFLMRIMQQNQDSIPKINPDAVSPSTIKD
ncbi:MAG: hypothetical protein QNJ55_23795 [Xenococcus sp. MO_188.B8]|nr:hypothetical protein [Xenococcus sp. MO_188.B8]